MTTKLASSLLCLNGMLGTMACDKPDTTSTTSARVATDPNDDVIESLTTARCHHEVICNNVGDGKAFADEATCHGDVSRRVRADMHQSACRHVDTKALQWCLGAIQNQSCDMPMSAIERITECGKTALCAPEN